MKNLLLSLCLLFAIHLYSQPTNVDTTYRKVYITAIAGVSSFLKSPIAGIIMDIEITDNKFPLVLRWENGFLVAHPQFAYIFDLSIGKRFKKADWGIAPFGFINQGGDNFCPTMGIYTELRPTNRFNFCMKANYYFSYDRPSGFGVTATLNYRLLQFKSI